MTDLNLINSINNKCEPEIHHVRHADYFMVKKSAQKKIDYVLDVGANIGLFSQFASDLFPDARIFSIEPCKEIYSCLSSNCSSNPSIVPLNCGFGLDGYCEPILNTRSPLGTIAKPTTKSSPEDGAIKSFSIKSLFNILGIKDNYLLKFDCEGSEKYMINDHFAEQCIKNSSHTALEIHFKCPDPKSEFFETFETFNEWIRDNFSDSHEIIYHKSNRKRGYGHFILLQK